METNISKKADLEEAADGYMQQVDARFLRTLEHPTAKDCFKAGAEWQKDKDTRDMYMSDNRHFQKIYELGRKEQKEQMLKEAVDGEVVNNGSSGTTIDTKYGVLYLPPLVYAVGDKVKIVIVKEEEK